MIETVKKQQNGYLVNGNMFVPNDESNREYQMVQQWIKDGGVVDPELTESEIEAQRKSDILAQIAAIETKQPRALREVALGMDGAVDRLRAIDEEISALRAQL